MLVIPPLTIVSPSFKELSLTKAQKLQILGCRVTAPDRKINRSGTGGNRFCPSGEDAGQVSLVRHIQPLAKCIRSSFRRRFLPCHIISSIGERNFLALARSMAPSNRETMNLDNSFGLKSSLKNPCSTPLKESVVKAHFEQIKK